MKIVGMAHKKGIGGGSFEFVTEDGEHTLITEKVLARLKETEKPVHSSDEAMHGDSYKTIHGKWWLFEDGMPIKPLSDAELNEIK